MIILLIKQYYHLASGFTMCDHVCLNKYAFIYIWPADIIKIFEDNSARNVVSDEYSVGVDI